MDKLQIIRFTQGLTTLVTEGKKDMTRRLTTDRRQYEVPRGKTNSLSVRS